jgi:putative transposase
MARLPRFFVADLPLHIIQRGNNRDPIFGCPADFAFFYERLALAARAHGVSVHAYVLMTNHLHLLVTPSLPTSVPRMMQSLGPVRAGMVERPSDYRWSSSRANAGGGVDRLIRPHPTYEQIGESAGARQTAYRELFGTALPEDDVRDIRDATQNAWALGRPDFQRTISRLARRAQRLPVGRKAKTAADEDTAPTGKFESDPL